MPSSTHGTQMENHTLTTDADTDLVNLAQAGKPNVHSAHIDVDAIDSAPFHFGVPALSISLTIMKLTKMARLTMLKFLPTALKLGCNHRVDLHRMKIQNSISLQGLR
jgi:hypothetical protein